MATTSLKGLGHNSLESPNRHVRKDFVVKAKKGLRLEFLLPPASIRGRSGVRRSSRLNSSLQVGSDGVVTLLIGSTGVNPNSVPGLTRILAQELSVDPFMVEAECAGPRLVAPGFSAVDETAAQRAMGFEAWTLRVAGAMAREMLISAAMLKNGDRNRENYSAKDGVITHRGSGKTYLYKHIAATAAQLPLPAGPPQNPKVKGPAVAQRVQESVSSKVDFELLKHRPALGGTAIPSTHETGAYSAPRPGTTPESEAVDSDSYCELAGFSR